MDCRRYETGPLLPCIIHIVASFITSSHQQEKSLWWSWTHHEYFKRSCFMHQPWTFGLAILHFWQNTRLDKQRLKFVGNRGLFCMRLFCHVTKNFGYLEMQWPLMSFQFPKNGLFVASFYPWLKQQSLLNEFFTEGTSFASSTCHISGHFSHSHYIGSVRSNFCYLESGGLVV